MTPAERIPVAGISQDFSEILKSHYAAALFCVAFGSAVSILFSIAVSQILLGDRAASGGAGTARACISRRSNYPSHSFLPPRFLPIFSSGHPLTGIPQIRKFFVFGIVVLISCAFRNAAQVRNLLIAWVGIAVLSAADGFAHVLGRRQEAFRLKWNTYDYYLDDRIKGFASHWMTFGAEQMIVLLMLLSFLLFACPRRLAAFGVVLRGDSLGLADAGTDS